MTEELSQGDLSKKDPKGEQSQLGEQPHSSVADRHARHRLPEGVLEGAVETYSQLGRFEDAAVLQRIIDRSAPSPQQPTSNVNNAPVQPPASGKEVLPKQTAQNRPPTAPNGLKGSTPTGGK
jgi:hypothetical protein